MEVNRLLGDELTYELQIRGLPIGNTVTEKRTLLYEAVRAERLNIAQPPSICTFPPGPELQICETKLDGLKRSIVHFDHDNRDNEFRRICTRLIHVLERLSRLEVTSDLEDRRSLMADHARELMDELKLVYQSTAEIEDSGKSHHHEQERHASLLDAPIELLPEVMHQVEQQNSVSFDLVDIPASASLHECRKGFKRLDLGTKENLKKGTSAISQGRQVKWPDCYRSQVIHSSESAGDTGFLRQKEREDFCNLAPRLYVHPSCPQSIVDGQVACPVANSTLSLPKEHDISSHPASATVPLSHSCNSKWNPDIFRWNVRYSGRGSVTDFLERIEELRISRGVSKDRLLQSAAELFTQEALLWYRTCSFSSWDELCTQLRRTFQPFDYEYTLWDEIRRRTQGAQESVVNFVVVMKSLFRKLSQPVDELQMISIIQRNFLPYIQTQLALHPCTTVSQLMDVAKSIEEAQLRAQKYQPPPTNSRGLVEPELRYRKPEGAHFHTNPKAMISSIPPSPPASSTQVEAVTIRSQCWNCGSQEHKFKRCPEPRRTFCFKCGKDDVTYPRCPNCQKNGQRSRT
nr:unnamed protein product [Callosobruchus analis]